MLRTKQIFILGLGVSAFALATGCRIRVPSVEEQQALVAQGAFPGGVPPWVVSGGGAASGKRMSGVIPSNYLPSKSESKLSGFSAEGVDADQKESRTKDSAGDLKTTQPTSSENTLIAKTQGKGVDSPIQRVQEVCPGTEAKVADAIITDEPSLRLKKFQDLTTQCRNSEDLWFWLAKEYLTEGRLQEAKSCLEQVLMLNRQHKEAYGLLNQLNSVNK